MKIREKAERYSWCRQSLEQMEQELERFVREGYRIPEEPGGWWHQYVCPEHHTELLFDPMAADADVFYCQYGCNLEGEPYRGGWLVFKHQSLARYALQAAAVYAGTGKAGHAELALGILSRYAEQFPRYPIHPGAQPWMLKGRAFHQALSEAIWATTLIRAYLLLRDEGVTFDAGSAAEAAWHEFLSMLESSMVQYRHILIHDQGKPESNYTAWLNAALAAVYAAWQDADKLQSLIEGAGGFIDHLSIGVKPDQFEFEGSTYYHVFVLRAYLITTEMAARFGADLHAVRGREGQSLEGMLEVLADLANDVGELPALHDGPYKREPYAREIAEILEIGMARYGGESANGPILEEAYRQLYGGQGRCGLEAVVFGAGEWSTASSAATVATSAGAQAVGGRRKSRLLQESGFAVLRQAGNPLSALVDFGPHGGSHGHYDKLHLTIDHHGGPVAPELGMVPYGSPLRKAWYAATESHNTVMVGGQSQAEHAGVCMGYEANDDMTRIWVRSTGAYEGCVLDRHLVLTGGWLLDWFEVQLEREQQIDWRLHYLAAGSTEAEAISLSAASNAYNLQLPIGLEGLAGKVQLSGLVSDNSTVTSFRYAGPADDPSKPYTGLLHRQFGTRASFVHVYSDGAAAPVRLVWEQPQAQDVVRTRGVRIETDAEAWSIHLSQDGGLELKRAIKEGSEVL